MFKNPYHLKRFYKFENFLTQKLTPNDKTLTNYGSNTILNYDDANKTIFEVRYHKFNAIQQYAKSNNDIIFINLKYLQDPNNCITFLSQLNTTYSLNHSNNYIMDIKHTKIPSYIKNREYNVDITLYKDIIDKSKNTTVEDFITNLTYIIH